MKKAIYFLSVCFLGLLFYSCSEDDSSNEVIHENAYKKETINYTEFLSSFENKDYLHSVSVFLKTDFNSINDRNGNESYVIDTTEIRLIELPGVKTYTFRVLNNDMESGFQNVILKDENGVQNLYLATYPDDFESLNLESPVQIQLKEIGVEEIAQKSGGSCIYITSCSEGVHNGSNLGSWGKCTAARPPVMNIAPCDSGGSGGVGGIGQPGGPPNGTGNPGHGTGGGNSGGGGGTGGGWGGGSGGSSGPNSGQSIPTDPILDLQSAKKLYIQLLLNYSQKQWLNQNGAISNQIWNYVQSNNSSEAKQFAKKLINLLISVNYRATVYNNNNYPGKDNGMPFNWWRNTAFLNDMSLNPFDQFKKLTKAEKILVALWPEQAYKMLKNKPIVESMTNTIMGHNGRNDKSDAFRHAFFNAINTRDVWGGFLIKAADIVRLFGEAHESEVPSNLELEKLMDLHNNDIGINYTKEIFSSNLSNLQIAEAIEYFLANGSLWYLNPLSSPISPPNFGITTETQLTPTSH